MLLPESLGQYNAKSRHVSKKKTAIWMGILTDQMSS